MIIKANGLLGRKLATSLLQKLLPEYAAAATALKEEEQSGGAKVVLAKVGPCKEKLDAGDSSETRTKVSAS